jgi:hypothetical protein
MDTFLFHTKTVCLQIDLKFINYTILLIFALYKDDTCRITYSDKQDLKDSV